MQTSTNFVPMTEQARMGVILPWPMSVNESIGGGRRKALEVNRAKQAYKQACYYALRGQLGSQWFDRTLIGDVYAVIGLCAPDQSRVRDIDNGLKWILDALEYSGLVESDSQIRSLCVDWLDVEVPGGAVSVLMSSMLNQQLTVIKQHEGIVRDMLAITTPGAKLDA